MARVGEGLAAACAVSLALAALPRAAKAEGPAVTVELAADRDDDDLDGVPDGEEAILPKGAQVDLVPLSDAFTGDVLVATDGGEHARLVVNGRPLAWGTAAPRGAMLEGLSAGVVVLTAHRGAETRALRLVVSDLGFRDGAGHAVDLTKSHASLDREPPSAMSPSAPRLYAAVDPLRVFVVTPADVAPNLMLDSFAAEGAHLDALVPPALAPTPCDAETRGLHCYESLPVRFVVDDVDRRHALASKRSIRAELGGAITLGRSGKKEQALRVLGPRDSPVGPIGRLRAELRPVVVRLTPRGAPSIGGTDAGAVALFRREIASAAAAWGECGVSFGPPSHVVARVVDPPPPYLLALGNDLGLPASGGHVRFRIDGTKLVDVPTHDGQLPAEVAREISLAIERAGFRVTVSPNARVASGAEGSVDVLVRRPGGALARLERVDLGTPVSNDPTLTARIGAVDLSNGLAHFGDVDSASGTLEERTLLKALDEGDAGTVEVVVVPFFTGGGRIGESFIGSDRGSLRDIVLLDRAGVRARTSSMTLAHELGHILLDVPGHPDDYGIDTPTRLMDADASDASPFGPRRLTLAECARVVRESGPLARLPLLHDWPLTPITYPTVITR